MIDYSLTETDVISIPECAESRHLR